MRNIVIVIFIVCNLTILTQLHSQSLIARIQKAKEDTAKISLLLQASRHYQYTRPDSAMYYSRQGINLSKKLNYPLGEARHISQLGAINEKHDNLELARKYMLDALTKYKALNHAEGMASQYNGLGIIEGKRGNFNTATNYFIKALRLYEKAKNNSGIVQSYIKLGVVNERSNKLDKALGYFMHAKKLNGDNPSGLYPLLNNIGIVEAKRGNTKKALEYFEKGSEMSDTVTYAAIHVNLLTNAANALDLLGNKKEALFRNKLALEKTKLYNLPEIQARILINLSSLEPEKNNSYLQEALTIATRIGNKQLKAEIYQAIADFHKKESNYKQSLAALEEYHKLMDTLFNAKKEREIAGMHVRYELEKSREHIKALELTNQKRTFERNAGGLAFIFILLGCGSLWYYLSKVRRLNTQLKNSNNVKDKLFSIISHDLRTPVAGIVQMMNVIESELLNKEEIKEMMQSLKKHSEASLETMNSLLLWGKTQLQGVKVCKTDFNSKPLIEKNLAFFHCQADQKAILFNDRTPAGLGLHGDSDHFDIVVRNLISNAIKYSHHSGIISINAFINQIPGMAVFAIKDDGKGMSDKELNNLFQPTVCSEEGTAGEKGTGLGLVLSKEFVQANGGNIWAESASGKGSVFYFSLPLAPEHPLERNPEKISRIQKNLFNRI